MKDDVQSPLTSRDQAFEALEEIEGRFRAISEGSPLGIIVTDAEGTCIFVNQAYERMVGLSFRECIGSGWMSSLHESDRERLMLFWAQPSHERPSLTLEVRRLRGDGSRGWLSIQLTQILSSGTKHLGYVGTVEDITLRKNAELALQESEERYRDLFENAMDLIQMTDPQGRILYTNRAWRRTMGYTEDEAANLPFLELLEPHSREDCLQAMQRVLAGESLADLSLVMNSREGRSIDLEGNVNCKISEGKAISIRWIFRDVTERRFAEQQLRFSEELYRTLVSSMDEGVILQHQTGEILACNPSAERILGVPANHLLGRLMPPGDWTLIRENGEPLRLDEYPIWQALKMGKTSSNVMTGLHRPDGELRWLLVNTRSLHRNAEEKPYAAVISFADVTEKIKSEKIKTEFISIVSHELRTPLTSILGALDLLAGGLVGVLPPEAQELVDIAFKSSERLVRLINDLLDMEKLESGKMVFQNRPIELASLIEQAVQSTRAYATKMGVEFSIQESIAGVWVYADPDRLTQVLENLLSNAVKFSPQSQPVAISMMRQGERLRVSINNRGPKIPESFQKRIFQKFAQADSSDSRRRGGTGLGLSIVKAILERLNGTVGFTTDDKTGTTFYFDLPIWAPPELAQPLEVPRPRVLVCEDNPDIAALLEVMLREANFEVVVAQTAQEAKEKLRYQKFDAMTLDLILPDQDGLSLLRELHQLYGANCVPVIVVSVYPRHEPGLLNGNGLLIVDWLTKPVDQQQLIQAVEIATRKLAPVPQPRVLHVDADQNLRPIVKTLLAPVATVDSCTNLQAARHKLRSEHWDLLLLDIHLPDGSGLNLIEELTRTENSIPIVIFSAAEIDESFGSKLAAVLLKTSTTNQRLFDTIQSAIRVSPRKLS